MRAGILSAVIFGLLLSPVLAFGRDMDEGKSAVLRTIDKVSARTRTFEVPVEKTVKFGNSLYIKLRSCRKSSPLDQPENAAFLQIWEHKPNTDKADWIFSGWMFSSNPSLSALEHPVYDVWVLECKSDITTAKAEAFSSETAPTGQPPKQDVAAKVPADAAKPSEDTPVTAAEDESATAASDTPKPADVATKPRVLKPAATVAAPALPAKPLTADELKDVDSSFDDEEDDPNDPNAVPDNNPDPATQEGAAPNTGD